MPNPTPESNAARLDGLERDRAELFRRLNKMETSAARSEEQLKNIGGDVSEARIAITKCAENCQAIREWVRGEMAKERKREEEENIEKRKLKTSEKIAIWTVSGGLLTAIIAAIAAIVTASHT